jgi:hypothetical protein
MRAPSRDRDQSIGLRDERNNSAGEDDPSHAVKCLRRRIAYRMSEANTAARQSDL